MKMHRCRICGETYLGTEVPSHCPFCGAHRESIVETSEYPPGVNDVRLTEVERSDLEAAVELERSNTRFYLGMSTHKDNDALASAYKRLSRVESEHCSLFCKLLRRPKPDDLAEPGETTGTWAGDIEESVRRERRAAALYAEFAERATSERLREVFAAVAEVERDHIELDAEAKRYV
ncbi:MAG: ferritin [Coriobacteriia bacterium]|nr:ferritin [Coriobacteriia bacterium]